MTTIELTKKEILHPERQKKYSATLRVWHWANMIVITGSLLTVLLNSTVLKGANDAPVIKAALQNAGAIVTDSQVKSAAHDLNDTVWGIHVYFGYGLTILLLFRLGLEFFQLADQKFIRVLKVAWLKFKGTKKQREMVRHELAVKSIYAIFYLLLIVMAVTGLFLAFEDFFAPYKSIRHVIKDVHGYCMYLVLTFIAVHLSGVFLAERKDGKGIVSDMINGG